MGEEYTVNIMPSVAGRAREVASRTHRRPEDVLSEWLKDAPIESPTVSLPHTQSELLIGVQELEQAVIHLTDYDLKRFREWFDEYDAKSWDEQLEHDAESGKLDKMAEKAIADFRAGKFKEL